MCQPFDDYDSSVSPEEFYPEETPSFCPDCGSMDMCECHIYHDYDDGMDGDFDSGMASAGHGTDEDYGYYGEIDYGYGDEDDYDYDYDYYGEAGHDE